MTEFTLELLREELAPIRARIENISAALTVMGRSIEVLRHDVRQVRAAVNDLVALQMTTERLMAARLGLT